MKAALLTQEKAAEAIRQGQRLLLAGTETLLAGLPPGEWIGGTTPYFMTSESGVCTQEHVFAIELPDTVVRTRIHELSSKTLPNIYAGMPDNGFGIAIIPAGSRVHQEFALNAPVYKGFANGPLAGWISGSHLNDLGMVTPKVFCGRTGEPISDKAVVLYADLADGFYAALEILNLFEPDPGDAITFDAAGFSTVTARINGHEQSFAEYIAQHALDTRLPLVADYCGAMINVSLQNVDESTGEVSFYAPVMPGVVYRHARPVGDYVAEFSAKMPHDKTDKIVFSCNCILNYLYLGLEGRSTRGVAGPITFGEIAYQLLNQTMAYLTIESA